MMHPRHRGKSTRGQSIVEFAMVVPILLLMLAGVADLGRVLFSYIALEDAAQEGAIYAAHQSVPQETVIARVHSSSNHAEVTGSTVSVACFLNPAPGTIVVTASYDIPLITPIISDMFGGSVHMTATFVGTNFKERC